MKLNIGVVSLGSLTFKPEIANDYLIKTNSYIKQLNHKVFSNGETILNDDEFNSTVELLKSSDLDLLIIQLGTFTKGEWMVRLIQKFGHIPFLLWGFKDPIVNDFPTIPLISLTSLNMFTSFMYRFKKTFSYIYHDFADEATFKELKTIIKAIEVKKALNNVKFLIIGSRVPGFYLSGVDELRLRKEIGIELEYYSLATLIEEGKKITDEQIDQRLKEHNVIIEPTITMETVRKSIRYELTILNHVRKNNYGGVTFKCWPEIQELLGMSACGILSTLIDEGISASCEGDVTGLATMYILQKITGKSVFLGDLVSKAQNNRLKMWHCGLGPRKLAAKTSEVSYTHQSTMRSGYGVAVQYEMKTDKVTICKLSEGNEKYRLFKALGQSFKPDRKLLGVQTDIELTSGFDKVIDAILTQGIEHHFALVHEDVTDVLKELCKILGIDFIDMEER